MSDEDQLQQVLGTGEKCNIGTCSNCDIDQRGPLFMRTGPQHPTAKYNVCTEHWEAIFSICGQQEVDRIDAGRCPICSAPSDEANMYVCGYKDDGITGHPGVQGATGPLWPIRGRGHNCDCPTCGQTHVEGSCGCRHGWVVGGNQDHLVEYLEDA